MSLDVLAANHTDVTTMYMAYDVNEPMFCGRSDCENACLSVSVAAELVTNSDCLLFQSRRYRCCLPTCCSQTRWGASFIEACFRFRRESGFSVAQVGPFVKHLLA